MDKSFSFLLYLSLYLSYRRPSPRWWRSNRRNSSSAPPTEVLAVLVIRRRQLLPRSKILATYLFPATVPTKQREDFAYKFGSHRYVSQPPLSFQIIWFAFIRGVRQSPKNGHILGTASAFTPEGRAKHIGPHARISSNNLVIAKMHFHRSYLTRLDSFRPTPRIAVRWPHCFVSFAFGGPPMQIALPHWVGRKITCNWPILCHHWSFPSDESYSLPGTP